MSIKRGLVCLDVRAYRARDSISRRANTHLPVSLVEYHHVFCVHQLVVLVVHPCDEIRHALPTHPGDIYKYIYTVWGEK